MIENHPNRSFLIHFYPKAEELTLRNEIYFKQIHENSLPLNIAILFSASVVLTLLLLCCLVSTFTSSSSAHILPLPSFHALLFQHFSPPLLPITERYWNPYRLRDLCQSELPSTITFHIQKPQALHRFLQIHCNSPL